ncbi:hypothetical protein WJX84_001534 [Apatococcus fuscideae]|uniref:Uncharacterized protein n=1 Tax=Apatococcus fuscideae TaxID=2026836 RepID=A0AAW1T9I7_9CHLO
MRLKMDDILQPDPLEMMIFVLYLFTALPQLIPKSNVTFNSKLQETQVSHIQLTNPGYTQRTHCIMAM